MKKVVMNPHVKELVLQSLEHERGGVLIYTTALDCTINGDLREEWEKYLEQTNTHVAALTTACAALGIDPDERTPGVEIVQYIGTSLVKAMEIALATGDLKAAELVACDCVVLAETKDHANWHLIGACSKALSGDVASVLAAAHAEVEDEEDEHLYHTTGWARELRLQALGIEPVLPPPEEERDVKTAIGAARAKNERKPVSLAG